MVSPPPGSLTRNCWMHAPPVEHASLTEPIRVPSGSQVGSRPVPNGTAPDPSAFTRNTSAGPAPRGLEGQLLAIRGPAGVGIAAWLAAHARQLREAGPVQLHGPEPPSVLERELLAVRGPVRHAALDRLSESVRQARETSRVDDAEGV